MNAMVEFVTGRCTNSLFCSIASAGELLRLPAGARFVCAHCGKALVPASTAPRRSALATGMIFGAGMALTGAGLFAVGAWLGGNPAPPALLPAPSAPVAHVAVAALPPVLHAKAPPVAVAVAVAAPAPPETVALLTAPAEIAATRHVIALTPNVAPPPSPSVSPPALPTVSLGLLVAGLSTKPAAPRHEEPRTHAAPAPRPPAPPAPARTKLPTAHLRIAVETRVPAILALPARMVVAAPARPVAPSRAFSPHAIAGGAPGYPAIYDQESRQGSVTVSCHIEANGAPTGCRVMRANGGTAFGTEVMRWLKSGKVRYAPILHDGEPVAATRQWTVDFRQ